MEAKEAMARGDVNRVQVQRERAREEARERENKKKRDSQRDRKGEEILASGGMFLGVTTFARCLGGDAFGTSSGLEH